MTGFCIWKAYRFDREITELLDAFKDQPYLFVLGSYLHSRNHGRYSMVGFNPFELFRAGGKECLPDLRARFKRYAREYQDLPTPLPSGIVGFFSYDLGLNMEKIRTAASHAGTLPECVFGFYDCILTVDHLTNMLYITSTGLPETENFLARLRAQERLDFILDRLNNMALTEACILPPGIDETTAEISVISNMSRDEYLGMVKRAKSYIQQGDIYQVNLSQMMEAKLSMSVGRNESVGLYKTICQVSPSDFSAYFDAGDFFIVSSSPEQFLRKHHHSIITRPMKGTMARGLDQRMDEDRKRQLINSRKDEAELLMVTDLLRNDLGRVCEFGSVKVSHLRALEEYATVFQTTSTIRGILRQDCDCFDAIRACFPSGSVTGCPKIRSMEIIDELETKRREIYTGSLGYIGFNGEMNLNVLIRTMIIRQNSVQFSVGGGIVSDSDPIQEYEETLTKAGGMIRSLKYFNRFKMEV